MRSTSYVIRLRQILLPVWGECLGLDERKELFRDVLAVNTTGEEVEKEMEEQLEGDQPRHLVVRSGVNNVGNVINILYLRITE